MRVQNNTVVKLSYWMQPAGDEVPEVPQGPFRVSPLIGHGLLLPALEKAILDMNEGQELQVDLAPHEAFGEVDPNAVVTLSRAGLADGGKLEVGRMHHVLDERGCLKPFRVVAVDGDEVRADFNSPLAGRRIRFRILIEEVRWASLEEIKKATVS